MRYRLGKAKKELMIGFSLPARTGSYGKRNALKKRSELSTITQQLTCGDRATPHPIKSRSCYICHHDIVRRFPIRSRSEPTSPKPQKSSRTRRAKLCLSSQYLARPQYGLGWGGVLLLFRRTSEVQARMNRRKPTNGLNTEKVKELNKAWHHARRLGQPLNVLVTFRPIEIDKMTAESTV